MATSTTDVQSFIISALRHHQLISIDDFGNHQLPQSNLATEITSISDRIKIIEDQKIGETIVTIEKAFVQADQYVRESKAEVQNLTQQMQASLQEIQKHKDESSALRLAIEKVHSDGASMNQKVESIIQTAEAKFQELEQNVRSMPLPTHRLH